MQMPNSNPVTSHFANPSLPQTDSLDEEHTITPAVHGTICLLESALKYSSIKRVVITSSINVLRGDIENEIYNGRLWFCCKAFTS